MPALEERVKAIEDEKAILEVPYTYAHCLDQRCERIGERHLAREGAAPAARVRPTAAATR